MEAAYNGKRLHSALGYRPPEEGVRRPTFADCSLVQFRRPRLSTFSHSTTPLFGYIIGKAQRGSQTKLPFLISPAMRWIAKAIVQKGISFLPFSRRINFFFQKYITKGVHLTDEYFEDRLVHCANHYKYFRKYNSTKHFSHLEIGTGWYPVVPAGIFLYGASSITTVDLNPLSNLQNVHITLKKFLDYHKKGRLSKLLPGISEERLKVLLQEAENPSKDFVDLLERHHIVYLVMDARKLSLPDASIDLITSNNTFEHVYPEVLEGILQKLKSLSKSGGVMSHAIDLSDHYAHIDKGITIYNFLRFSDAQWKWIDNSIQPLNRLRIYDYRNLHSKLSIPVTEEINSEFDLNDYRKVKVDKKFSVYSEEENAVSHSLVISVMSGVEWSGVNP